MPAVMERTVSVDRALAQRAERKLHRYGWSVDDALTRALTAILVVKGRPDEAFRFPADPEGDADLSFDDVEDAISYLHAHV